MMTTVQMLAANVFGSSLGLLSGCVKYMLYLLKDASWRGIPEAIGVNYLLAINNNTQFA